MSRSIPKYRQTCDSCRKSKTKCNSEKPICSRCLVTGADCDYGISNQGGRWKNGQKLGSRSQVLPQPEHTQIVMPENATSQDSLTPLLAPQMDVGGEVVWQDCTSTSWDSDSIFPSASPYNYWSIFTLPISPISTPSMSPRNGFDIAMPLPDYNGGNHFDDPGATRRPPVVAPEMGELRSCTCIRNSVAMIQNFHQKTSSLSTTNNNDQADSATCAMLLDLNEEAISFCATALDCRNCRPDERADLVILVSTLLRRTFSLARAWALEVDIPQIERQLSAPTMQQEQQTENQQSSTAIESRNLRIEVLSVTANSLENLIPRLKEAGQVLSESHDRLACAALCAAISQNLRTMRSEPTIS